MDKKSIEDAFEKYIAEYSDCLTKLKDNKTILFKIVDQINTCFKLGGKILFIGNGGSAADSQHLAAEFVGRYKRNRLPLPAIALTADTSVLTAIGNDMGYEKIFERQVRAIAKENDILFAISTSGESANIIEAVKAGNEMGIYSISLTGVKDNSLSKISNISMDVPATPVNHVQEMHILVGHFICEMVENSL